MKKQIFYNDTRPGKKAKYYSITCEDKNYVYSHQEDMNNWVDIMNLEGKTTISGKLEELTSEYDIIELDIKEGNRKPNKQY